MFASSKRTSFERIEDDHLKDIFKDVDHFLDVTRRRAFLMIRSILLLLTRKISADVPFELYPFSRAVFVNSDVPDTQEKRTDSFFFVRSIDLDYVFLVLPCPHRCAICSIFDLNQKRFPF